MIQKLINETKIKNVTKIKCYAKLNHNTGYR